MEEGRVAVCKRLKGKYKKAFVATGLGGQDIKPWWLAYLSGQFI
jgi:hypothetical protein